MIRSSMASCRCRAVSSGRMRVSRPPSLLFTKTNSGGTDHVWFYDLKADGWSLDDKRRALLPEEKLGAWPS